MRIVSQMRLLAAGSALLSALLVGSVFHWGFGALVDDRERENLALRTGAEARRVQAAFEMIRDDVRLLSKLPVAAYSLRPDLGSDLRERARIQLEDVFAEMLRAKRFYHQIRLIGVVGEGREVARVERAAQGILRVAPEALQRKGARRYFEETLALAGDAVYFSEIDLNRERGVVEVPHRPVVRVAARVESESGRALGILVVNVDFAPFADEIFSARSRDIRYVLTNDRGDYLFHPDPDRTFGFERGRPQRAQDDHHELAPFFSGDTSSLMLASEGHSGWSHWRRVDLFPETGRFLVLGIAASHEALSAGVVGVVERAAWLTGLMVILALAGAVFLSTWLTRPLEEITVAAERISRGVAGSRLPTDRPDEIGRLARAIDQMLAALREKEARLRGVNLDLMESNADLEHFNHVASHQLREPARRLAILADLLAEDCEEVLPEEARTHLGHIQKVAEAMLGQIADYRTFANVGRGELSLEPVDLDAVVDAVLAQHAPEIERRCVRVSRSSLPTVRAYASLVPVLYERLVENALRHTPGEEFELELTGRLVEGVQVFGVRNRGVDIAEESLGRIFTPFERLLSEGTGAGLGLAICNRIVERHGGRIWAESAPGEVHVRFTLSGGSLDG